MAGIKHHIQNAGMAPGQDFNKIEDPIARDLAYRSMNATPHCKKCGNLILPPAMEERRDYQLEVRALMHEDCLREVEKDLREKEEAERKRRAEEERQRQASFDWDKYMQDMINNREG